MNPTLDNIWLGDGGALREHQEGRRIQGRGVRTCYIFVTIQGKFVINSGFN
jgi:hypothetical protein